MRIVRCTKHKRKHSRMVRVDLREILLTVVYVREDVRRGEHYYLAKMKQPSK